MLKDQLGKPSFVKKRFFWKSLYKMVTPPRPPFIEQKKRDDFEGCLKGVLGVFEGCCRVFEVCLKGVWTNQIEV